MAFGVAQEVNTLHQAGFDLNGNGRRRRSSRRRPAVAGAAAATCRQRRARPPIRAWSPRRRPARPATTRSRGRSRRCADQRCCRRHRDASPRAGRSWPTASAPTSTRRAPAAEHRRTCAKQVERLRDQVSGVSLDEEAASMIKFQRAYEANAKFFTVVDEMLDDAHAHRGRRVMRVTFRTAYRRQRIPRDAVEPDGHARASR